ncbi:hypothetical protein PHG01_00391 [Streptococcus mutans PKUSS-HG01]|nr:hypothetical protein PLG01_00378 [Streptococcus mutans PKUSS-LG01]ESS18893.1 hypothetical protein PHG01_00391 [Streptococcus mutans PKUSS-HG01]
MACALSNWLRNLSMTEQEVFICQVSFEDTEKKFIRNLEKTD